MLLLTWHGTLVGLRDGEGIVHEKLPAADLTTVDVDADAMFAEGPVRPHRQLGAIVLRPGAGGRGVSISRHGRYLCAEPDRAVMAFDRAAAYAWEGFLPIDAHDLALLRHILAHRWIVRQSRAVIPKTDIRLTDGFMLQIGGTLLDLERSLSKAILPPDRRHEAQPDMILLPQSGGVAELVSAGPRSSALIVTEKWPVRARRTAELLVLAAHRQLAGREPEQAEFEAAVTTLLDRGGPAGLDDLLEELRSQPGLRGRVAPPPVLRQMPEAAQTVVGFGTSCITACLLHRLRLDTAPMPFDWLSTTPAMIRHCLETDFSVLLDRAQYRSLTGLGAEGEPDEGCAHDYYAREHGIARVFNHSDPTRDVDYRYLLACVDRLRDVMASAEPKLFVQIREMSAGGRFEFDAMATLLDRLTRHASYLQIAVAPPDRRLAAPTLTVGRRQGPHTLYRLHPTSQMGGEDFAQAADSDFAASLIAAHAARPATMRLVAPGDRTAVLRAAGRFGADRPAAVATADEAGRVDRLDRANRALRSFLEATSLPRRFNFATFDPAAQSRTLGRDAAIVRINGQQLQTVLQFDQTVADRWTLQHRALVLFYLLDCVFAAGPVPDTSFLADLGDAAHEPGSAAFCSDRADSLLLPDPDFFVSAGHEELRAQLAAAPQVWDRCASTVFWRGVTTGERRHAAPGDGEADDFTWLPRLDLCARARRSRFADHFDVGISAICQIDEPHLVARIEGAGLCRPPVPRAGFLGHKAILVIDGNANAWSALFCALLTGACVLKVASPKGYRQWYYDALEPGVHFVPVATDLSDLDEQVDWLLTHDAEARAIGAAGRALAVEMTFDSVMEDAADRLRLWLRK